MFNFFSSQPAFGLDISDLSLKLIQLRKFRNEIKLHSSNEMPVPAGYIVSGVIKKPKEVVELIQKTIKTSLGNKILTSNVVVSLPETKTFIKLIEIFQTENKKFKEVIKEEIGRHIPLTDEEIYFDWQIIQKITKNNEQKIQILIGAAPKNIVDFYTDILKKAGLMPQAFEIEACAIVRDLIQEKNNSPRIILDLGASCSSLIIYNNGTIQFSISIPLSGEKITEKIAEKLKITLIQAEKAKKICGFDEKKCEGITKEILAEYLFELSEEIKKILMFHKTYFAFQGTFKEMLLCGGASNLIGLDVYLSEQLGLEVKREIPWIFKFQCFNHKKITWKSLVNDFFFQSLFSKKIKSCPFSENKFASYATVLGLALRGVMEAED
ncbi:type IV pilus assembly protein PilM [Candidatus Kuenenbacteria bacterium]|nr:type IV pilus assembly protein PilM [Candidatus Kuenenbacteria bacterium]